MGSPLGPLALYSHAFLFAQHYKESIRRRCTNSSATRGPVDGPRGPVDGPKDHWMVLSAFVPCPHKVSNRAVLCPLCYFHCIDDIDLIAEGEEGAITGSSTVRSPIWFMQMTCAFLQLGQTNCKPCSIIWTSMPRRGLTINTPKSEVVHFNSHGLNVPAFSAGGAQLANKDSIKYIGMVNYRTHNIGKSAEHTLGPFMAGCHSIRQFAREHHLIDRPHALLWSTIEETDSLLALTPF